MKTPKRGLDRLTWDPRTERLTGLVAESQASKRVRAERERERISTVTTTATPPKPKKPKA